MPFEAYAAMLAHIGAPSIPAGHPSTGAPFVECELSIREESDRVLWGPPIPPTRNVLDYDEDGIEFDRELTDEQYETAMRSYERAAEEWRKTGGVAYVRGPTWVEATFRCADGSWAKMMTAPGAPGWRCTEEVVVTSPRHRAGR